MVTTPCAKKHGQTLTGLGPSEARLNAVADLTRCMELSGDPTFAKRFVSCLNFP